jgi:hypothetical protein
MAMILHDSLLLRGVVALRSGVAVKMQRGFGGIDAGYPPTSRLSMRHPSPCCHSGNLQPEQRPDPRDAIGAGRSLSRAGVLSSASATGHRQAVLAGGQRLAATCWSPLGAMHVSVSERTRCKPAAGAALR